MRLAKLIRRLWYAIAALIILAAIMVSVSRLLTPVLNAHLPDFEAWSSRVLELPIKIGHVEIYWDMYEPMISFDRVTILDKQTQKPRFVIQRIVVNMGIWRSLTTWQLVAESIKATGVNLTIRQPTSSKILIDELGQLAITDNATGVPTHFDDIIAWIFSQPRLILENIGIDYHLPNGARKSITLENLTLKNDNLHHQLRGKAKLNQSIPMRMKFLLKWTGNVTDLPHMYGRFVLNLEGLSLPEWFGEFSWKNLVVKQGLGSARIAANWHNNTFHGIRSEFQFYDISLLSTATHKSIGIPRISGEAGWKRFGDKQVFTGDDILIDLPEHLWQTTNFIVTCDANSKIESIRLGYLDLNDVKRIALASGLLPTSIQDVVKSFDPFGELREVHVSLPAATDSDFLNIPIKAQFENLTFKPWQKYPGITNISGSLSWDGKAGYLDLKSTQASMILKSLFANPLHFEELDGSLRWQKTTEGTWSLTAKNLRVFSPDIKAHADMTLNFPLEASPDINLTASFDVNNVASVSNYLPLKIFDPDLMHWLQDAFLGGKVTSGKVTLRGRLADFPFEKNKGSFVINGSLKDLTFSYAPKWPVIQHLNGELTFTGSSMVAVLDSGEILGSQIKHARGEIPYIGGRAPQILTVDSEIKTDSTQGMRFIQQSPLQKTLGQDLAGLDLSGPMDLKLRLVVPLKKPENIKLQGDANLSNANLKLSDWDLALYELNGAFRFTENDFQAKNIQGKLFDEPFDLSFTTRHPKNQPADVKAILRSKLSMTALQAWSKMPVTQYAQGVASYQVELHLTPHTQTSHPTVAVISSDLKGIDINLPAPYGKKLIESRALELTLKSSHNAPLQTRIKYTNLLDADLNFQKIAQGWGLKLQSGRVNLLGQELNDARIQISKTDKNWNINIDSAEILGQATIATNYSTFLGKFQRLHVAPNVSTQQLINPATLPAMKIIANDVRYGEKRLGNIMLDAIANQNGLQIKEFHLESPVVALHAVGSWQLIKNQYSSHLQGELSTPHISQMLTEWDMSASALIGSTAKARFNLSWPNAPYNPSPDGMSGSLTLKLGSGRIVNLSNSTDAKIGLGRLLNVFSLQSIPRRLSLDFSDLFENGYSFDNMNADFSLKSGNAYTENMRFDGPVARVDLMGRIGLQDKDYDLMMNVTPYVTSSLPVVATIASSFNPVVGVATWMVDKVVSHEVSKATTYQYKISGPWDQPVWEELHTKKDSNLSKQ